MKAADTNGAGGSHVNYTYIKVDEKLAREILLARAVETVDTQGRLIADAEREELDLRAIEAANASRDGALDVTAALSARAGRVLELVGKRDPALASLREVPSWRPLVGWGLPLLALLLGVVTDQIANPHRIDLLSLPLLAIVLWNLAIYLLLLFRSLRHAGGGSPPLTGLRDAAAHLLGPRRSFRRMGAEVRTQFLLHWQAVAARVNGHRVTLILHLCAAAWGAGVALSLFVRGLAVEYRVGWESTFLDAEQVRIVLSVLFWPVTTLFSLAPFTQQEIAAMRFDAGAMTAIDSGRRWVYLYAGLLVIVVVIPRLALAAIAWLRVNVASRRLTIDLSEPYFQQLIDRLVPSQVRLLVYAHRDADRTALLRVLRQHAGTRSGELLLDTPAGDALTIRDLPVTGSASPPVPAAASGGWNNLRTRLLGLDDGADRRASQDAGDVVLHVVGAAEDLDDGSSARGTQTPVLLLVTSPEPAGQASSLLAQCLLHRKHHDFVIDVLSFDAFARCWVQEPALLDAIARSLPRSKSQGYARLVSAWAAKNRVRFGDSMSILAGSLAHAAREAEEVRSAPLSIRTILSKEHRAARADAKTEAMAVVVERLKRMETETLRQLLELHRVADMAGEPERIEQGLEVKVNMQSAVDAPQAGLAGAASGAAMGASVDLVTGGLTLGVAALLGAMVGGSAAFLSAAWNNRKTPSGASTIQLSDEMMQALVEASLLRYLAVIHLGRTEATSDATASRPAWNSEVVATVAAHRDRLKAIWTSTRSPGSAVSATAELARELETIAKKVLRNLYPEARIE